jgi:hypothetical protein
MKKEKRSSVGLERWRQFSRSEAHNVSLTLLHVYKKDLSKSHTLLQASQVLISFFFVRGGF